MLYQSLSPAQRGVHARREKAISYQLWTGADIGACFQYGAVRVSVPPGVKLMWPMKRHNPYRKDGSSSLVDARLVLCLPFSSAIAKQEIELEITNPAKP